MRRAILVSAIATALVSMATPAEAAFPGKNGKIAVAVYEIVAHGASNPEIATGNPDCTGSTVLRAENSSFAPAWSPDGEKVAFTHLERPEPFKDCGSVCMDVYVMNADGSGGTHQAPGAG